MRTPRELSWKEMPMSRLVLAFMPGIGAGVFVENLPVDWIITGIGLAAIVCLVMTRKKIPYRFRFAYAGFCLFFWMLAGSWAGHERLSFNQADYFGHHPGRDSAVWEGEIIEVSGTAYRRCIIQINSRLEENGRPVPASGKLLVYPGNDSPVEKGQIVLFRTAMRDISSPKNPLGFDNKQYRFFQNIHLQAYWKEGDYKVIGKRPAGALELWRNEQLSKWREALEDPAVFSIAGAMVFGYKDEMPEEIRETYAATGASHVLAVSGLHVGLIYLFCSFLLRKLKWRFWKAVISLIVIWGFAFLTGATPSVLRASTMFSFVLIGQQMRRPISIYNSLAGSALFLLIVNPLWLFNIGFQLSYLAVLGIVVFQPLFYHWWIPSNQWVDKIWTLITVSLAAQLATLPLTLFYFHQFPVYFWLSGLVVVPAAPVIIGLGIMLILFSNWIPALDWIPALLLDRLIGLINGSLEMMQSIPGSVISGIYIQGGAVLVLFASLILLARVWETRSWRYLFWVFIAWNAVAISRCVTDAAEFCRSEMIVYHTPGHTLIDVMHRGRMVTYRDEDLEKADEDRAAEAIRQRRRIRERETVFLRDATVLISTDSSVAVIAGSPAFEPEKWAVQEIIATLSNKRWRVNKWKEAGTGKEWTLTDIRETGACIRPAAPGHWPFLVPAHR